MGTEWHGREEGRFEGREVELRGRERRRVKGSEQHLTVTDHPRRLTQFRESSIMLRRKKYILPKWNPFYVGE